MKKMLFRFAKENGKVITHYRTERVDYSQVYYLEIEGMKKRFADSYIVGEPNSRRWLIDQIQQYIINGTY